MPESLQKILHTFSALADLSHEIANTGEFDEMVNTSLQLLLGSIAIMRGGIVEYQAEAGTLTVVANRGLDLPQNGKAVVEARWVERLREAGISLLHRDDRVLDFDLQEGGPEWLASRKVDAVVPMVVEERFIGVLLVGAKASGDPYSDEDRSIVNTIGRQIAVGIRQRRLVEELKQRADENERLYDGLRTIYQETVRAFAAAIDCKDRYTQGHSERVGKYSEIIAEALGWSKEEVEGAAVAGYLHDVGKLAVERDIINAPYKIDAKSSSELNKHPAVGYEILAPIRHPYADIPQAAHYHHERLDGRGYPEGLTADQIPLGVKIVSLADSFDAMTTDRPYRRRRSLADVIDDLERNTGTQFDPLVVAMLCRAMLEEFQGRAKERRFLRLLGKDYLETAVTIPKLEALIAKLPASASHTAAAAV